MKQAQTRSIVLVVFLWFVTYSLPTFCNDLLRVLASNFASLCFLLSGSHAMLPPSCSMCNYSLGLYPLESLTRLTEPCHWVSSLEEGSFPSEFAVLCRASCQTMQRQAPVKCIRSFCWNENTRPAAANYLAGASETGHRECGWGGAPLQRVAAQPEEAFRVLSLPAGNSLWIVCFMSGSSSDRAEGSGLTSTMHLELGLAAFECLMSQCVCVSQSPVIFISHTDPWLIAESVSGCSSTSH